jgi:hypothetical protein
VLEAGKHGQHHDDASKKVTAPAGVAVVSFTRGFRPGPAVNPIAQRIHAEKNRLWHTDKERQARFVECGAGSFDRRLTTRSIASTPRQRTPRQPPRARCPSPETMATSAVLDGGPGRHHAAENRSRQAPPCSSQGSEEEAPKLADLQLLRHHGAPKPRHRWSRCPPGPSRPNRARSPSAATSVRRARPRAAGRHHAPSAPPARLPRAAVEPPPSSLPPSHARPAPPRLGGEGERPAAADAARALPGDALRRRREEGLR